MLKNHPEDLLAQATHLKDLNTTLPEQVNLRQAISCAYYALFHTLTSESVEFLIPPKPSVLRAEIVRKFSHSVMKGVCEKVAHKNCRSIPNVSQGRALGTDGLCPKLKDLADSFTKLQNLRHEADYDLSFLFEKDEADRAVEMAKTAIRNWHYVVQHHKDEAITFAAALLFGGKKR